VRRKTFMSESTRRTGSGNLADDKLSASSFAVPVASSRAAVHEVSHTEGTMNSASVFVLARNVMASSSR
jgi:hypothetical protein